MPSVLAILGEGFEEIEAVAAIDILRRGGVDVTTASTGPDRWVEGRSHLVIQADGLLGAAPQEVDCLLLPGGPGVKHLRANPAVLEWARSQRRKDGWIAAICAAPLVLLDAGLLEGYRFTSHFSAAGELPQSLQAERTVVDRRLITSRGAGTAIDFGLVVLAKLVSQTKADEVAKSIAL